MASGYKSTKSSSKYFTFPTSFKSISKIKISQRDSWWPAAAAAVAIGVRSVVGFSRALAHVNKFYASVVALGSWHQYYYYYYYNFNQSEWEKTMLKLNKFIKACCIRTHTHTQTYILAIYSFRHWAGCILCICECVQKRQKPIKNFRGKFKFIYFKQKINKH